MNGNERVIKEYMEILQGNRNLLELMSLAMDLSPDQIQWVTDVLNGTKTFEQWQEQLNK